MTQLLKSIGISALANAASLAVAAWLFDNFNVRMGGFIFAVVLFTLFTVALKRIVGSLVNRFVRGYTVVGGLILTWIALLLTDLVVSMRGFSIEGFWTWAGVTAIVWAAGIAYGEVDNKQPEPPKRFPSTFNRS